MLNQTAFWDLYEHPFWLKRRDQIIERDFNMCWDCFDSESVLQVHHIYYDFRIEAPWDYPDNALITLCRECHKDEHRRLKNLDFVEIDWQLQRKGFRAKDFESLRFLSIVMSREKAIGEILSRKCKIDTLRRERFAGFMVNACE